MLHAIIISGGTEKKRQEKAKTIQKEQHRQLISSDPDTLFIEKNGVGIDDIRYTKRWLNRKSYQKNKIVIIQKADSLTLSAQNAFLKTLEEPPGNALIILLTQNRYRLLETVVSRCQIIHLSSPSPQLKKNEFPKKKNLAYFLELPSYQQISCAQRMGQKKDQLTIWFQKQKNYYRCQLSKEKKAGFILHLIIQAEKMINNNISPQSALEYIMLKFKGKDFKKS